MGTTRDGKDVKKKWTDLKYRAKKKAAIIKNSFAKTGGGPPSKLELTDLEEEILEIIGSRCIEGIAPVDHDLTALQLHETRKSPEKKDSNNLMEKENLCQEVAVEFLSARTENQEYCDEFKTPKRPRHEINESSSAKRVKEHRDKKKRYEMNSIEDHLVDLQEKISQHVAETKEITKELSRKVDILNNKFDSIIENLKVLTHMYAEKNGFHIMRE